MLNRSEGRSQRRFKRIIVVLILLSIAIMSFIVRASANTDFIHQFNIPKGNYQPYQIGLPGSASESVTPTIEVTMESNHSLFIWLLTEQGYSLLKEGNWFGNESVAKYEFAGYLSVSFQWTFSPGETKYLVLDACNIQNQDWNESNALGSVKITNTEELSASSYVTQTPGFHMVIGIAGLALIPVFVLLRGRLWRK